MFCERPWTRYLKNEKQCKTWQSKGDIPAIYGQGGTLLETKRQNVLCVHSSTRYVSHLQLHSPTTRIRVDTNKMISVVLHTSGPNKPATPTPTGVPCSRASSATIASFVPGISLPTCYRNCHYYRHYVCYHSINTCTVGDACYGIGSIFCRNFVIGRAP